ncbi:MAG: FAD-dependent oxidoreductase, partial [Deltaproteobacteria bacterium]|nr:FAD-dependent oxidoreductase [Deltaproteobacteria bacterium]
KTGSWRYMRPVYEDKTPPCGAACPAGVDVVRFLMLVESGKVRESWLEIKKENPFPGVCGRVCPHPCEAQCNRGHYDQPVSINALERYVADATRRVRLRNPDRLGKRSDRVAVIGSGPAGLSCAYHLALLGYRPEVFETLPLPGGILRFGIPEYRLPVETLNREIADIEALGVKIRTGTRADRHFFDKEGKAYQAIFVATGAGVSRKLGIPGEEGRGVIPGLSFLREIRMGRRTSPGRKVAVIGGGNTALDAARSAKRLGSHPLILYRRSREEMPAFEEEIVEALEEGIDIEFLAQPVRILRERGRVAGVECVRMRLGDVDGSGRRRPLAIEGSNFTVEADGIVVAIGESPDTALLPGEAELDGRALILTETSGWESGGIFLGGDLVSPVRTVAHAIGSGKRGAIAIDAFLRGHDPARLLETVRIGETGTVSMRRYMDPGCIGPSRHVVSFEELNTAYFRSMGRTERERIPAPERTSDFNEVNRGFTREEARYEAERCFKCGTCNDCENCYVFCPDVSVLRSARTLEHAIDYDHCKGCGICFSECPRAALSMVEEEK